jgi:hypothetical protein
MDDALKKVIMVHAANAAVGAGVVAGVVTIMGGSRQAILFGALGGAIAGLVNQSIADYVTNAIVPWGDVVEEKLQRAG